MINDFTKKDIKSSIGLSKSMEHKPCTCLYPNDKKDGYIEFVDDTGAMFIRFKDRSYICLNAEQVRRAMV